MPRRPLPWTAALLFVLAGCIPPVMVEPTPRARVAFDRSDGATAQEGRPILVAVDDAAHLLDQDAVKALAAKVTLKTWPEAAPVATSTEIGRGSYDFETLIRVVPTDPLEDRWYLVSVDDLPPGVLAGGRLPDGTVGVRFRPGAHPRVAKLQLCPSGDAGTRLVFLFSEPVAASAPADEILALQVARRASRCESAGGDATALALTCDDQTAEATPDVTVSVGPGIVGATGVALDPVSWQVDPAALPLVGACRELTPPI